MGHSVTFTAVGGGGGPTPHYQWVHNGNSNPADTLATYTSTAFANDDSIRCIYASSSGCAVPAQVSSNTVNMVVHNLPTATVSPSGTRNICSGDSVLLTAGGGTSYVWNTTATSPTIYVKQSNTYTVTATDANHCSAAATTPAIVVVNTITVPTISQVGNVLTASTVGTVYRWYVDSVLIPADSAQSMTMTHSGKYQVVVYGAGGCSARSLMYIFTVSGISTIVQDMGVRVYPIPNRGTFIVESDKVFNGELTIYDIYGKDIYKQEINGQHTEINAGNLPRALYFVTISNGEQSQIIKMNVADEQ
jgi:hypothetical protein